MAKKALCPAAGLVRNITSFDAARHADIHKEDPSEFFSMIFGGEAFVDW